MESKLSLIRDVESITFYGPEEIKDIKDLKVYKCDKDIIIGNAVVKKTSKQKTLCANEVEYTFQKIKKLFNNHNVQKQYHLARQSFIGYVRTELASKFKKEVRLNEDDNDVDKLIEAVEDVSRWPLGMWRICRFTGHAARVMKFVNANIAGVDIKLEFVRFLEEAGTDASKLDRVEWAATIVADVMQLINDSIMDADERQGYIQSLQNAGTDISALYAVRDIAEVRKLIDDAIKDADVKQEYIQLLKDADADISLIRTVVEIRKLINDNITDPGEQQEYLQLLEDAGTYFEALYVLKQVLEIRKFIYDNIDGADAQLECMQLLSAAGTDVNALCAVQQAVNIRKQIYGGIPSKNIDIKRICIQLLKGAGVKFEALIMVRQTVEAIKIIYYEIYDENAERLEYNRLMKIEQRYVGLDGIQKAINVRKCIEQNITGRDLKQVCIKSLKDIWIDVEKLKQLELNIDLIKNISWSISSIKCAALEDIWMKKLGCVIASGGNAESLQAFQNDVEEVVRVIIEKEIAKRDRGGAETPETSQE